MTRPEGGGLARRGVHVALALVTLTGVAFSIAHASAQDDASAAILAGIMTFLPYAMFVVLAVALRSMRSARTLAGATAVSGLLLVASSCWLYWFWHIRQAGSSTDGIAGLWILLLQLLIAAPIGLVLAFGGPER